VISQPRVVVPSAPDIEMIEAEAWAELQLCLPQELRSRLDIKVQRVAGAVLLLSGAPALAINRVIGLGLGASLATKIIGGMKLTVDGKDVSLPDTVAYRGIMLSGVPNFALTLGYTNASWTLKADLVSEYICRLLKQMDARGQQIVTPLTPGSDAPLTPFLDLKAGYIQRSIDQLPKQGPAAPWKAYQNYARDLVLIRRGPVDDGVRFSRAAPAGRPAPASVGEPVTGRITA